MATRAQLEAEPWWGREIIPPNLAALRTRLLARWRLSGSAIGIKGNTAHLRGYHRSREWIRNSRYCTNRSYSVSETANNKSGGDSRWVAAMDITLPTELLMEVCRRLDAAVRAGRLEKVTEWYGNTDGDNRVDGYDNIRNRVATSDSSHLWHLHISFDRARVNEPHDDLYEILTGDDDMTPEERTWLMRTHQRTAAMALMWPQVDLPGEGVEQIPLVQSLVDLSKRVAALEDSRTVALSPAQVDALADQIAGRLGHGVTADEMRQILASVRLTPGQ